jgi:hypothetical protein
VVVVNRFVCNQLKNSKSFGIILAQTLTAIELWLVACIGFLFMSLIELGLIMQAVTLLDRDEKKRKKKKAKYSFTNALFNRGRDKEVV